MDGVQVKLKCMFDMEAAVLNCEGEEEAFASVVLVWCKW